MHKESCNVSQLSQCVLSSHIGGNVVLWYCGTVGLWYCGTVVLWYCGTVGLWYCGTVLLWYCGSLQKTQLKKRVKDGEHDAITAMHYSIPYAWFLAYIYIYNIYEVYV